MSTKTEKTNGDCKVRWSILGKVYEKKTKNTAIFTGIAPQGDELKFIEIKEKEESSLQTTAEVTSKSPGDPTKGTAVDAMLAIHFIRNLWCTAHNADVEHFHNRLNTFLNEISIILKNPEELSDKAEKLLTDQKKLQADSDKYDAFLKAVLNKTYAITISKSILLKTLSQRGCEGIRFYLARKKQAVPVTSEKTVDKELATLDAELTLVTVGIDERENDLLYHYSEKGVDLVEGDLNQMTKVDNASLCSEYAKTATTLFTNTNELSISKVHNKYALYKFATYKNLYKNHC